MFVVYANSITKSSNGIQLTMYADEIAVLFKNKSVSNMEINRFVQLT